LPELEEGVLDAAGGGVLEVRTACRGARVHVDVVEADGVVGAI